MEPDALDVRALIERIASFHRVLGRGSESNGEVVTPSRRHEHAAQELLDAAQARGTSGVVCDPKILHWLEVELEPAQGPGDPPFESAPCVFARMQELFEGLVAAAEGTDAAGLFGLCAEIEHAHAVAAIESVGPHETPERLDSTR